MDCCRCCRICHHHLLLLPMLPPVGWCHQLIVSFLNLKNVYVAALGLLLLFFHHRLIVELSSPRVAVAVFVATISWLLPHLSPPLACAAFVAAGWLLPPVDCFIIRIIIILFTSLRWACLFFLPPVNRWASVTAGCWFLSSPSVDYCHIYHHHCWCLCRRWLVGATSWLFLF